MIKLEYINGSTGAWYFGFDIDGRKYEYHHRDAMVMHGIERLAKTMRKPGAALNMAKRLCQLTFPKTKQCVTGGSVSRPVQVTASPKGMNSHQ